MGPQPAPVTRRTEAVFIVGASRSGTSLMRQVINKSDEVAIAKENHFLGHLISSEGVRQRLRRFGDLTDDQHVRQMVDALYSGRLVSGPRLRGLSTQWHWIIQNIDREELLARILASDRSERALFTLMMRLFADRRGKPIIGEKTPAHYRYATTLLEWFPNGKIIHMLRDPRAVFVSELRRRSREAVTSPYRELRLVPPLFTLFVLIQTTITWRDSVRRGLALRETCPDRYHLQRFEDLVREPEDQVRRLCDFLGVSFGSRMLEQKVISQGFALGEAGFDAGAADRWRREISPLADRWFVLACRGYLRRLGYLESDGQVIALSRE